MSAGSCSPLDWFPVHLGSGGHSILPVAGEEAEVLSVAHPCPAGSASSVSSPDQTGSPVCQTRGQGALLCPSATVGGLR